MASSIGSRSGWLGNLRPGESTSDESYRKRVGARTDAPSWVTNKGASEPSKFPPKGVSDELTKTLKELAGRSVAAKAVANDAADAVSAIKGVFNKGILKPIVEEAVSKTMGITTDKIIGGINSYLSERRLEGASAFELSAPQSITVAKFKNLSFTNGAPLTGVTNERGNIGNAHLKMESYSKVPALGGERLTLIGAYKGKREPLIFQFYENPPFGEVRTTGNDYIIEMPAGVAFEQLSNFSQYIAQITSFVEGETEDEVAVAATNEAARLAADPLYGSW